MTNEHDSFADEMDKRLSQLFAEYREACPDPEPGAAFTPRLWERIEARQGLMHSFRRLARTIITAAAAASVLMGAYWALPQQHRSLLYSHTYLELLASDQGPTQDAIGDAEIIAAVHERAK
jgi:hypothetical protein